MKGVILDRPVAVPVYAWLIFVLVSSVLAQSISPSHDSLPSAANPMQITFGASSRPINTTYLTPLTAAAGLDASKLTLADIKIEGDLVIALPNNQASITQDSIAYLSCDPNSNVSNIDPSSILVNIDAIPPKAIILYSLEAPHCGFNGTLSNPDEALFSMTSTEDAYQLLNFIQMDMVLHPTGTIHDEPTGASSYPSASSSSTGSPSGAPTTAVAMSILYSITGIITALFLVIIATGAIRAHRHPERYGPRRGNQAGRPRQSRAKGLAKAMLETLPIVKFGDTEPVKPGNRDIELVDGIERDASTEHTIPKTDTDKQTNTNTAEEPAIGPDTQTSANATRNDDLQRVDTLVCSICTEEFTKGEDVRVLPCDHKYHPACIDPWLLNVSGTCPLCRVNLNPSPEQATASEGETALPPPLEHDGETVMEENMDSEAMRTMPAGERLAALQDAARRTRATQPSHVETDAETRGHRNRLASRLRDTFRIHTRRSDTVVRDSVPAIPSHAGPAQP